MTAAVDYRSVYEIAQDVFVAMVDGDEGLLLPWDAAPAVYDDPLAAWVDVHGPFEGRVAVTTQVATAHALVRALLDMPADAPVVQADLVDAFGEIANIVGGSVKALLPEQGTLSVPHVAAQAPADPSPPVQRLRLAWRGEPLDIDVWMTPEEGETT